MKPEPPGRASRLPAAANTRFVLVRTSHPGNIGAAARAMRTMGFTGLDLVSPHRFPHPEAVALASGAVAVLEDASVHESLAEAVAECTLVLGATARNRLVRMPELDPGTAAEEAHRVIQGGGRIALVFGNERNGLDNDEIARCHAAIRIPSDPDFPSLNLAQAVQLLAWELRKACVEPVALATGAKRMAPATHAELEALFVHLEHTLEAIDFHKGREPDTILRRLRRLFLRAAPDSREVRILHGILADVERTARG